MHPILLCVPCPNSSVIPRPPANGSLVGRPPVCLARQLFFILSETCLPVVELVTGQPNVLATAVNAAANCRRLSALCYVNGRILHLSVPIDPRGIPSHGSESGQPLHSSHPRQECQWLSSTVGTLLSVGAAVSLERVLRVVSARNGAGNSPLFSEFTKHSPPKKARARLVSESARIFFFNGRRGTSLQLQASRAETTESATQFRDGVPCKSPPPPLCKSNTPVRTTPGVVSATFGVLLSRRVHQGEG